ncbi:MAG: caspase family protein [Myxococcales bacterium]|nr:caspase family protein [Myxococcales bacterium]
MRRFHLALLAAIALSSAHCATTTRNSTLQPIVQPVGREAPTELEQLLASQTPEALETRPNASVEQRGTLGERPRRAGATSFEHPYAVLLQQGERVQIDLRASFDTVLRVVSPDGQESENDDVSNGVLDSRLVFTAASTGIYRVIATSYRPNDRGAFRLSVARGSAVSEATRPAGTPPDPRGAAPIADHADVASDLNSGTAQRTFRFDARRGDWLELETHHAAFDTVLELRGPAGESWQNDDRVSGDLHSRLAVVAPADGTYVATVRGYRPNMQGAFKLRFERLPRSTRQDANARVAGPRGRGLMYGVFLGIRDYGNESNSLPHCDEDATELARVLRDRGVMPTSRQLVLTNGQVTPAAARAAIQQFVGQLDEDDVLLIFYSGHGRQVRGAVSPTEPDGMDETIALRGGGITDDEMSAILAPARGTVILALDSCYSGGFARDVINGPRRIGLFASDEDVLSQVAERFSAGGYLSYWLRTAFSGEADRNHDGLLLLGELSDYLLDRFAQFRGRIATTGNGDFATQQHPRIERGSVEPGALVLRLPE